MQTKKHTTTMVCICVAMTTVVAWAYPMCISDPDQPYAQMTRTAITPVHLPFQRPFSVLRRVPGPSGNVYAQVEWQVESRFRSVVWEVHPDGSVAATYDLTQAGADAGSVLSFAVDSFGNVYFVKSPDQGEQKAASTVSLTQLSPSVYVFRQGGTFDKAVALSKSLEPRQLAITNGGNLVVAGSGVEVGMEGAAHNRQVLYEFKSNGDFIREIHLVSKEKKEEGTTPASADPGRLAILTDLSHLLVDPSGNIYLIQPSDEPRILRFGADGELAVERKLPKLAGTMVTEAILDEQGRLVLQRNSMRKPLEPKLQNPTRVLTILNAQTLDTTLEALVPPDTGEVVGVKGSDFIFLGRHGPLTLDIITGSLQ
ncbi:MAG: hypothetical protein DMG37_23590 [Acidobacteria bacterium]|nr:MAG: hypothetical protein DMG37_23590 [Acidobacteriota bacterium]